jgi:hypothetical protein
LSGVIVEITEHNSLRVGVVGGVLMTCYYSQDLQIRRDLTVEAYNLNDILTSWKTAKKISVRAAVAKLSLSGGQGISRCGCKKGACNTNSCSCFKSRLACTPKCHCYSTTYCKNCEEPNTQQTSQILSSTNDIPNTQLTVESIFGEDSDIGEEEIPIFDINSSQPGIIMPIDKRKRNAKKSVIASPKKKTKVS